MSQMTNYTENAIADHVLGTAAMSSPTSIEVGLFTSSPGETGDTTNEITVANGYNRKTVTFAAASGGSSSSNIDVSWTASGTFVDGSANTSITHIGLFDNLGNVLFYGALSSPQTVNNGDTLTISSGSLTVTFT